MVMGAMDTMGMVLLLMMNIEMVGSEKTLYGHIEVAGIFP